jgi:MerR family copper efflux transcriptional regulator
MESSRDRTFTIGQLAKRVGLSTSALRFYEEQGLLHPFGRSKAGYRQYLPESELTIRFIQRAQRLGFSLAEIRTLLTGLQKGDLSDESIISTAEKRYIALEQQVTQLQVLQHELEHFLQDMRKEVVEQDDVVTVSLFDKLIDRVCANPLAQPVRSTLELLMEYTGCNLGTEEGKKLLNDLRDQHVHIWQEEEGYNILVVSDDPSIGEALSSLADLEANCQTHAHTHQSPELMHNREGFLLRVRGENAFIFARLFLVLQDDTKPLLDV